jgi:hypothetical protein
MEIKHNMNSPSVFSQLSEKDLFSILDTVKYLKRKMLKKPGVYKLTNKINLKAYIGETIELFDLGTV